MANRYDRVYNSIKSELDNIIKKYQYENYSEAYGHFIIKMLLGISDDDAYDSMTDGYNDNGIDAIYIDNKEHKPHIYFFQFKFPQDEEHISKTGLTQNTVNSFISGYKYFTSNESNFKTRTWNEDLLEKRKEYQKLNNTDENTLYYICFSSNVSKTNIDLLAKEAQDLSKRTGNNITTHIFDANKVSEIYENVVQNSWPSFEIKYNNFSVLYSNDDISIYNIFSSLYDLYESLNKKSINYCEGNVRYYNKSSKINEAIRNTIMTNPEDFYVLNSGITIVCTKAHNMTGDNIVKVDSGSVINGAQTVGCIDECLQQANKQMLEKYKKSYVSIKIIQLSNKSTLAQKLVYTLNAQNQMNKSFAISNDPNVIMIQKSVNKDSKYFLEIKKNEFYYEKNNNRSFDKLSKNVISIEEAIQIYTSYEDIHGLGYLSKANKAQLFDEKNITAIIEKIEPSLLIKYVELYEKIMEYVKKYRRFLKDKTNKEILKALKIKESEISNYSFIKTGNFLILYLLGKYNRKNNVKNISKNILTIINMLSGYFIDKDDIPNLTKTKQTFDDVNQLLD